ncbi:hypothetical protein C8Q77DRAFT_805170 [Trametes polyzona]|nr:hypothetical protein C8Q77DRAFT_805170 [Trametes polyzona]
MALPDTNGPPQMSFAPFRVPCALHTLLTSSCCRNDSGHQMATYVQHQQARWNRASPCVRLMHLLVWTPLERARKCEIARAVDGLHRGTGHSLYHFSSPASVLLVLHGRPPTTSPPAHAESACTRPHRVLASHRGKKRARTAGTHSRRLSAYIDAVRPLCARSAARLGMRHWVAANLPPPLSSLGSRASAHATGETYHQPPPSTLRQLRARVCGASRRRSSTA